MKTNKAPVSERDILLLLFFFFFIYIAYFFLILFHLQHSRKCISSFVVIFVFGGRWSWGVRLGGARILTIPVDLFKRLILRSLCVNLGHKKDLSSEICRSILMLLCFFVVVAFFFFFRLSSKFHFTPSPAISFKFSNKFTSDNILLILVSM